MVSRPMAVCLNRKGHKERKEKQNEFFQLHPIVVPFPDFGRPLRSLRPLRLNRRYPSAAVVP
jgi:hypothetical protein